MNKKVVAGVAVTVTAASIATNLAFKPEELLHDSASLSTQTACVETGEVQEASIEYTAPRRIDVFRAWVIQLPVAVKAALLLPLWVLGALPAAIGTGLFTTASPLLSLLTNLLLQAAVLVGVFCGVYKLLFPNRKLRELFQKKNRWWLLLGAALVVSMNFGLSLIWPAWSAVRIGLTVAGGFVVLCLLWRRICGKLRLPAPGGEQKRLLLDY